MKYLKEYRLFENESEFESDREFNNIIKKLEKYCSKYLDILTEMRNQEDDNKLKSDNILYRGYKFYKVDDNLDLFKFKRRFDRNPANTREITHQLLGKYSKELFGWDMRSSGVFASGSKTETTLYGTTFIFLPIGNYSFLYNENIMDLTRYLSMYNIDMEMVGTRDYTRDEVEIDERIQPLLNGYTDKDLINGINKKVEISFNCDEYFLLNVKYLDFFLEYINNRK